MKDARPPFSQKDTSRTHFDMIVTFREEACARQALAELRRTGFSPEQAILLHPAGPTESSDLLSLDGHMHVSPDELVADRATAITVILITEGAVGAVAGAVLGWLISLFFHAPEIGPVWIWMLILGAVGAALGLGLGSLEWKRWQREMDELRQQFAIGMRFIGRHPANDIKRARAILERHGGSGIDNT